ncbi:MAG: hypothetical protein KF870_07935 [Leadbetterella sp.]|nr:hypothetical protein [Leadbetterella sp.]
MKRVVCFLALVLPGILTVSAQKNENGTVYIDHPALKVVTAFEKATVEGDSAKMSGLLTDDFKAYNGTTSDPALPSSDRLTYVRTLLNYSRQLDYFAIEAIPGSYPDALEYKKDNKNGDVVVQNWVLLKGVHKTTGVKLDAAGFRIYYVTKEGKIKRIISYANGKVLDEIFASFSNRTNGTIYNHHANVNTARKAMYAWEKGDIDQYMSYYGDNAEFYDINTEWGKTRNKAEEKANIEQFRTLFEIKSIDMIGYPDYLEYEMDNGREVLSWWKINLVRKSDKKAIMLPMHLSMGFDENGKIISESAYYSESMLMKK